MFTIRAEEVYNYTLVRSIENSTVKYVMIGILERKSRQHNEILFYRRSACENMIYIDCEKTQNQNHNNANQDFKFSLH